MYSRLTRSFELHEKVKLSIVIPTYNESANILKLVEAIHRNIPDYVFPEIIVVDDNSPDGTGKIVDDYIRSLETSESNLQNQNNNLKFFVKVVHRKNKNGLISAILEGINSSKGEIILVMDADLSHPPEIIPSMVKELMLDPDCDLVVASRYVEGGSITGWPFKRKLISKGATKIAQHSLGIKINDPMSGFFAFRHHILENIKFDAIGYKILLEILVKAKEVRVKEIPYNFIDRKSGSSKLDTSVVFDYVKSVWKLYRYGKLARQKERRTSVRFLSKAGRFYTVGASGLFVNYLVSFLFGAVLYNLWYIYATMIGIIFSMTSNFILNKIWTFEDKDLSVKRTFRQYVSFLAFSGIGAAFQLGILYFLVGSQHVNYASSLFIAVAIASTGNFILNKRWTFREKIWS